MVIRLAATAVYLRVSPRRAARVVLLERSEHRPKGIEAHTPPEPYHQPQTWPRWMFFIMGILPAAIKLTSFSGTPWTKAWGLMFTASFIMIELIILLARVGSHEQVLSVPEILGLSLIEWQDPQNQKLPLNFSRLKKKLKVMDVVLFLLAVFIHLCVGVWAVDKLWSLARDATNLPDDVHNGLDWLTAIAFTLLIFLSVVWIVLRVSRSLHRRYYLNRTIECLWIGFSFVAWVHSGIGRNEGKRKILPLPDLTKFSMTTAIWLYVFALFWVCHRGMSWICRRWPAVGKALLIDPSPRTEKLEVDASNEVEEEAEVQIDNRAWVSLCFFLTNLMVCILWYAFIYDPKGSLNPSWTDVFG